MGARLVDNIQMSREKFGDYLDKHRVRDVNLISGYNKMISTAPACARKYARACLLYMDLLACSRARI